MPRRPAWHTNKSFFDEMKEREVMEKDALVHGGDPDSGWLTSPLNPDGYNVAIFNNRHADRAPISQDPDLSLMMDLIKHDAPVHKFLGVFNFYQVILSSDENGFSLREADKKIRVDSKETPGNCGIPVREPAIICDWNTVDDKVKNLEVKVNTKFNCAIIITKDITIPCMRTGNSLIDLSDCGSAGSTDHKEGPIVIKSDAFYVRYYPGDMISQPDNEEISPKPGGRIRDPADVHFTGCIFDSSGKPLCSECVKKKSHQARGSPWFEESEG